MGDIKKGVKDRTGEKWVTNEGYTVEIIEYIGCYDCTIEFDDGTIIKNREYGEIKKGTIKNPYHKSVFGVGYFGVGKYSKKANLKIYKTWNSMLGRCYDSKYQEKRPTYKGCSVDEQWHNFQNFACWFEEYYKEEFTLDKDVLFKGNKIYSSTNCTFVPIEINGMFIKCNSLRGRYPIGVHKVRSKFEAQININSKKTHLGLFKTIEEAFQAYKVAKESYIKKMAEKWKEGVTPQTHQALINYQVEITD